MGLSESSFSAVQEGVCICHWRSVGHHAHVPLVFPFNSLRHGEACFSFFFDYLDKQKLLSDREHESSVGAHYTSVEGSSSPTRFEILGRFCKPNFGSIFEKVRVKFWQSQIGVLPK